MSQQNNFPQYDAFYTLADYLKYIQVGIVTLVGVIVPGLLFLFLFTFGLIIPILSTVSSLPFFSQPLPDFWESIDKFKVLIVSSFFVIIIYLRIYYSPNNT